MEQQPHGAMQNYSTLILVQNSKPIKGPGKGENI